MTAGGHAAGGDHRRVASDGAHLRHDGEGADVAGVAGGIHALGDDHVDAGFEFLLRLTLLADQPPDLHAAGVGGGDEEVRIAETRSQHRHLELKRDFELLVGFFLLHPAEVVELGRFLRLGDAVAAGDVVGVVLLLLRDLRQHFLDRRLGRHRGGEHQVDAERLVADALAQPLHVGFDLVRAALGLAEHGEGARVDDRRRDILAVGEGDDRVFDAEHVAQFGAQWVFLGHEALLTMERDGMDGNLEPASAKRIIRAPEYCQVA